MPIRTITAPGVQVNEIDKSDYTPTMTGTAVYLKGFSDKGEAYRCMEVTTRSAFEQIYGTPHTEAERYFYAGACEVLNQGGRLFTARLPYDNASFEKFAGVKYTLGDQTEDITEEYSDIYEYDNTIKDALKIKMDTSPVLYELSTVNGWRANEIPIPVNSFVIVDTTCGTYQKIAEDSRKGQDRELIGIVPVVTTAANALLVQNMVSPDLEKMAGYDPLKNEAMKTLIAKVSDEEDVLSNGGLLPKDALFRFSLDGYYTFCSSTIQNTGKNEFQSLSDANAFISAFYGNDSSYAVLSNKAYCQIDAEISSTEISGDLLLSAMSKISKVNEGFATWTWETTEDAELSGKQAIIEALADDDEIGAFSFNGQTYWLTAIADITIDVVPVTWQITKNGITMPYVAEEVALDEDDPRYGWHGEEGDDSMPKTLGLDAAGFFPVIQPAPDSEGFDPEHLKDIGVIVYKAYLDISNGDKVNFEAVEAYCGSLCKDDKDPVTKGTKFIDDIINNNSKYINFFSNCFNTPSSLKTYREVCDMLVMEPSPAASLGFYSKMTTKDISINKSILDGLNKAFEQVENINKLDIDIVPDAGIANIASYLRAIFGVNGKGPYDLNITSSDGTPLIGMWKATKAKDDAVKMWKTVLLKYDNFCKNVRKDCMFVADGLRPLVIQGQKKIVRETKPDSNIDKDILPFIPVICGINTSYGAGYCNWFEQADDYSGDFFWCPPSIKATGSYINTDVNHDYWLAPAGFTRGLISATDVSFNPNSKQAGSIYEKNWNYAIEYPREGIVLEGQKTFQTKPTALDRVNVRRTLLRLERQVYKTVRYFVYENNTAYTRQRIVDAVDPVLKACWQAGNGGLARYKIICDESNNTADTIDNNELRIAIGVVPNKTAEFIMVDFIIGSHKSTWEELF